LCESKNSDCEFVKLQDMMGMRAQPEKYGGRYGPHTAVPAHMMRGRGGRQQVIMDTEENLSDKEIYPPSHMNIPSIGNLA